jgi:hypothetical protein
MVSLVGKKREHFVIEVGYQMLPIFLSNQTNNILLRGGLPKECRQYFSRIKRITFYFEVGYQKNVAPHGAPRSAPSGPPLAASKIDIDIGFFSQSIR